MNKTELSQALAIAQDKNRAPFIDRETGKHRVDISIFDGFGLHGFQPVHCTLEQVAFLIVWQCFNMDGSINAHNFDELATAGRHKFLVVS